MHRVAQVFVGFYLAVILLTWPATVIAFFIIEGGGLAMANRRAWSRFNEIRRDPYSL